MELVGHTGRLTLVLGLVALLVGAGALVTGCQETQEIDVYFISAGESAIGLLREVPAAEGEELATTAMEELLAGMTDEEIDTWPVVTTEIPEGTELLGLTVEGGIATVDLSSEYEEGAGSFSIISRVGQVVYTLTDLDGIDAVDYYIEGERAGIFSSEGLDLSEPQDADMYHDALPIDT